MSVEIQIGDCLASMRGMPEKSVHCCVTSPPYFGLRDYGHAGQIGLEDTPDAFVARLVEVFREVRRVLRDDGTLWLNLGDSYATQPGKGANVPQTKHPKNDYPSSAPHRSKSFDGLKPKDLIGIPWRVAFALQADGWYLRQDIIWHKPNPMPESVTDRCTKAHEYVFLLSKSARYYFDAEAIKEKASQPTGKPKLTGQHKADAGGFTTNGKGNSSLGSNQGAEFRNRRSVWTISTKPFKGAHFATFPPDLIEPCILAGCPVGGTVLDPFGGAGTTGLVAKRHDRNAILCELNPEYAAMARERIDAPPGKVKRKPANDNTPPVADLFGVPA